MERLVAGKTQPACPSYLSFHVRRRLAVKRLDLPSRQVTGCTGSGRGNIEAPQSHNSTVFKYSKLWGPSSPREKETYDEEDSCMMGYLVRDQGFLSQTRSSCHQSAERTRQNHAGPYSFVG
ncbi:uncharacterized protein PGTG_02076 [Puccinia graminis f. sp. tritici CRL 75-36-700-3]|uniref:Uncharacterized protein n=1 Tax=Puccinia graminis f. sp. tritici (strain CRL 75-36-700-3 / race SCCL) TaxID=418459 RepID=E3JX40_PUCGT|nr:uncharacterized protein PGTG_02076 [Puccinia graminis f. sp. tritici CRL 75-36-700-3]EFP76615.2 hypothetical protein PGTG_02076 [Puccinia graminis f. sp. tritici CRL 75-36-700-3]